jgi:hypothetical protein
MNLYEVQWTQRGYITPKNLDDCSQLVMAASEKRAKWVIGQLEDCEPMRGRPFTARLIRNEEELRRIGFYGDDSQVWVEDERDYAFGRDYGNMHGAFLGDRSNSHKWALIDDLREMWRRQENEQRAKDLQISIAL